MTTTAPIRKPREVRARVPASTRRVLPCFVAGLLLVVAGMVGFTLWSRQSAPQVAVVVLLRDVPAGHQLGEADLKPVRLRVDPQLQLVRADRGLLGRTAKVPLMKGTLLTEGMLGPAAYPAHGVAVLTLPVAQALFDPGLTAGSRVSVVLAEANANAGAAADPAKKGQAESVYAVVARVVPGVDGREATVSLELSEADASAVAAQAPGKDISLLSVGTPPASEKAESTGGGV